MTSEERIDALEAGFHAVDKRQENFETFVKAYIADNRERMKQIDQRMDKMDARMDKFDERMDRMDAKIDNISSQVHNLTIASTVGIAAIVVAIVLSR